MNAALDFDEASHTYSIDGAWVPNVTRILEVLHDFRAVPASVLDVAMEFGTHVHEAIALELEGRLDRKALDPALAPYVDAAMRVILDMGIKVVAYEKRVYHRKLWYAGTLDLFGEVLRRGRERPLVLDWKTGVETWRHAGPQTAAYAPCVREDGVMAPERFGVLLTPGENFPYRLKHYTSIADWNLFVSCLNIFNHKNDGDQE